MTTATWSTCSPGSSPNVNVTIRNIGAPGTEVTWQVRRAADYRRELEALLSQHEEHSSERTKHSSELEEVRALAEVIDLAAHRESKP